MASIKDLRRFDAAEYLDNEQALAVFLSEAMKTADPAYIAHAIGVVARSKGMADISARTGLSREQLYRSLSERGNPTLATLLSVLSSLGLALRAEPARKSKGRRSTKRSIA